MPRPQLARPRVSLAARLLGLCALGLCALGLSGCHTTPAPLDSELLVSETSPLADLAWMNGSWVAMDTNGVRTEEHWAPAAGGMMLGMHRTIRGNGGQAFFEYMRIALTESGITYFASPGGRPAVPFYLAEQEPFAVTFSNPEHDYPQVIRYWLAEDGKLHAQVMGQSRGRTMEENYAWRPAEIAR